MTSTLFVMNELYRRINDREIPVPLSRQIAIQKAVKQALATMLVEVPLAYARALGAPERTALVTALQHVLDADDQVALSKRWDPARSKIEKVDLPSLGADLAALLNGEREPYSGVSWALADARNFSPREMDILRVTLSRVAPTKDLKAVLKRWDPHLKPPADRPALAKRAVALLDGAALTPAPVAAPPPAGKGKPGANGKGRTSRAAATPA